MTFPAEQSIGPFGYTLPSATCQLPDRQSILDNNDSQALNAFFTNPDNSLGPSYGQPPYGQSRGDRAAFENFNYNAFQSGPDSPRPSLQGVHTDDFMDPRRRDGGGEQGDVVAGAQALSHMASKGSSDSWHRGLGSDGDSKRLAARHASMPNFPASLHAMTQPASSLPPSKSVPPKPETLTNPFILIPQTASATNAAVDKLPRVTFGSDPHTNSGYANHNLANVEAHMDAVVSGALVDPSTGRRISSMQPVVYASPGGSVTTCYPAVAGMHVQDWQHGVERPQQHKRSFSQINAPSSTMRAPMESHVYGGMSMARTHAAEQEGDNGSVKRRWSEGKQKAEEGESSETTTEYTPPGPSQSTRRRSGRGRQNLTDGEKRHNHIMSEQKRRNVIKQAYSDLERLVPVLSEGRPGLSKADALKEAITYLEQILACNDAVRNLLGTS